MAEEFTAPAPADARPVEYASFARRLGAALLDSLFWIIAILWLLGGALLSIGLLIVFMSLYFQLCEKRWGQTIGKNATGIRVLSLDRSALTWNQTAWRNLLRLVDLPLALVGADYLIVRGSPRQQRLGDRAAKTIVVRERPAEATPPAQVPYGGAGAPTTSELFAEASEALGSQPAAGSGSGGPLDNPTGSTPPPPSAERASESRPAAAPPKPASSPKQGDPGWRPAWTAPGFPYATWDLRRTVLGLVIGLLVGGLFAPLLVLPFDPHLKSTAGLLVAQALLEVTLVCVAIGVAAGGDRQIQLDRDLPLLGLRRVRAAAFGWMALGLVAYYTLAIAYANLLTQPSQKDIARNLGLDAGLWAAIPVALLIAIAAPIAEEIFFRGMLFGGLRRRLSTIPSALISALVFGGLHATSGISAVPVLIIFGFVLALLYERTGSLLPGMVAHALNNSLALLVS